MAVLEIVTDASIKTYNNNRTFGCAGALCITTGAEDYMISQDTTNNRSELLGIYLACKMAKSILDEHPDLFDAVIIYSDSKFAIYGLTQWMDAWINTMDCNGILYGSNGKPVKNQELFLSIISYVVYNKLRINFRHCAGHINPTPVKLKKANEVFNASNGYYLRQEDIYKVSYYNSVIDKRTRAKLQNLDPSKYPVLTHANDHRVMTKFRFPMEYKEYVG